MKYLTSLVIRLLLLFIPISLFSLVLTPITVYGSYFILLPFFDVVINNNTLIVNGFPFVIVEACVAAAAYFLLWVLCLLTKDIKLKNRIKLIFYGFLLILGMNLFRIALLITIALKYGFEWFTMVHLLFWYFVLGVYTALVWIFLVHKLKIYSIPIYDDLKFLYKKAKSGSRR